MNGIVRRIGMVVVVSAMAVGCAPAEVSIGPDPDCHCPPTGQGSASSTSASSSGAGGGPVDAHRLRRLVLTSDDSAPEALALKRFDTERGENCAWQELPGGVWYCLPEYAWLKSGWYSDASCVAQVAILDNCPVMPNYVRDDGAKPWEACHPVPLAALYELGPALPADAVLYSLSGGICAKQPPQGPTVVARPIGASVSLDVFASATLVTE